MNRDLIRPSPRVVATSLPDGTAVLLHLDSKFYFTLNATAAFVWSTLAAQPTSAASLADGIAREFECTPETARRDVDALLRELEVERLVEPVG